MIRPLIVIFSFLSAIFFPWPLTALLALGAATVEPLVPLAVGVFVDTLYYTRTVSVVPLFTLGGAAVTLIALFVRSRLRTSSIGR